MALFLEELVSLDISIVFITKDRGAHILKALRALALMMSECEIIVVEDSRDGTREMIEFLYCEKEVRVINGGFVSATHAANVGLSFVTRRYVLFLGDDHIIEGDVFSFLRKLEESFDKAEMVGLHLVAPGLSDHSTISKVGWFAAGQVYPARGQESGYRGWSSLFAVDTSKVHLTFDERFKSNGFNAETDFQLRAKRQGARLWYAADLIVRQQQVPAKKGYDAKMEQGHIYFVRKHFRHSWLLKQVLFSLYIRTYAKVLR